VFNDFEFKISSQTSSKFLLEFLEQTLEQFLPVFFLSQYQISPQPIQARSVLWLRINNDQELVAVNFLAHLIETHALRDVPFSAKDLAFVELALQASLGVGCPLAVDLDLIGFEVVQQVRVGLQLVELLLQTVDLALERLQTVEQLQLLVKLFAKRYVGVFEAHRGGSENRKDARADQNLFLAILGQRQLLHHALATCGFEESKIWVKLFLCDLAECVVENGVEGVFLCDWQ
jgi:hypothetical protein